MYRVLHQSEDPSRCAVWPPVRMRAVLSKDGQLPLLSRTRKHVDSSPSGVKRTRLGVGAWTLRVSCTVRYVHDRIVYRASALGKIGVHMKRLFMKTSYSDKFPRAYARRMRLHRLHYTPTSPHGAPHGTRSPGAERSRSAPRVRSLRQSGPRMTGNRALCLS